MTSDSIEPMLQIDLPLAAELFVVVLLLATMDCSPACDAAAAPPLDEPKPEEPWSVATDLHAQRILRLERHQAETRASNA